MKKKNVPSIGQGIMFSLILILAILIFLTLLRAWGGLEFGDVIGIGQLLVELLLIPAAILAFIYTIHEIRESREESKLNLSLPVNQASKSFATMIDIEVSRTQHVNRFQKHLQINVLNEGKKVAVWWRAKIRVPIDLYDEAKKHENPPWRPQYGEGTQWAQEETEGYVDISFISRGEHPSYPGYPQILLRLVTDWDKSKEYKDKYLIPYEIYTASSGKFESELTLRIVRT